MNDATSQYKETQILTASPEKLLLMLYDGAILSLEKAIEELEGKRQLDKVNSELLKAQEIVGELMATLDLEKGGEIALNLQSLYAYFLQKIMRGNVEKDASPLKEVLSFMKELKEGWKGAIANQHKKVPKGKKSSPKDNPPSGLNISG